MSNIQRSNFQAHPFHLVSPSPWPLYSSISLLTLTTSAVSAFHGFSNAGYVLGIALVTLIYTMSLWFRDIISEGRVWLKRTILSIYNLNIAKAIPSKEVEKALDNYRANNKHYKLYANNNNLGYYIAGLLEGDGHISLPALGTTTLNRVLNPRIVFTSHISNLGLYALIQSKLGNIGRFQMIGNNTIRYNIGDKNGIILFYYFDIR